MLDKQTIMNALPRHQKKFLTNSVMDKINELGDIEGVEFADIYRNNFVSYVKVLSDPQYRMSDYMNAVKFVSFKVLEYNMIDSYMLTFPDRYRRLLTKYAALGDEKVIRREKIGSFASEYNKNKLVNEIFEQTIIPTKILNAPLYQEALNVQGHLMLHSKSDFVRTQAANSILTHLRPNETTKIELDIGLKENDAIADLRKVTQELSEQQQLAIKAGVASPKFIAESVIIEREVIDVEEA